VTLVDVERAGAYLIVEERHVAAATRDTWGNFHQPRHFQYAVRRRHDRSLVIRTETFTEARDYVARILEPGVLSR
jgi:hypothetical protein